MNNTSVSTFDNATFSIDLGEKWHTVFLYTPKQVPSRYHQDKDNEVNYRNKHQNIAVIARDLKNGKVNLNDSFQLIMWFFMIKVMIVIFLSVKEISALFWHSALRSKSGDY